MLHQINNYETDFYSWTQEQATLLKQRRFMEADLEHIIAELENMGASERRELINRLAVLLAHLLKWRYQPSLRSKSWKLTINEQRRQATRVLMDNPGLKSRLTDIGELAYGDALLIATRETGLEETTFPAECPWDVQQFFDNEFWPD